MQSLAVSSRLADMNLGLLLGVGLVLLVAGAVGFAVGRSHPGLYQKLDALDRTLLRLFGWEQGGDSFSAFREQMLLVTYAAYAGIGGYLVLVAGLRAMMA